MSTIISDIREEKEVPDLPENVEEHVQSVDASFVPFRVFMNHVDTFNAKYIASYLADQFYGEKKLPGERSEDIPLLGEEENVPEEASKVGEDERNKYEIIGTLSSDIAVKTEDVSYIVSEDSTQINEEIANSGVIIYDITRNFGEINKAIASLQFLVEKLDNLKKIGPKTYANSIRNHVFILISTVMTWAKTKTTILEEPGPFTEAQFRKRKSHPDYKEHLDCERAITALGKKHKSKLKTYVLACGFTYGYEEESMDFLFKMAWLNNQHLPVFGNGTNHVPLIHVSDLAKIIVNIVMDPPSKHYIIAVEPVQTKWKKIVMAISKILGKGFVKEVTLEEATEFPGVTERNYTQFSVNLNMEPAFILQNMEILWEYQTGFLQNAARIVEELKEMRELYPVKIIIHGPPCSGKTRLAKRICEEYGLHYVSVRTMIEETLQGLRDNITEEKARLKAKQEMEEQKALVGEEEILEEAEDEEEVEEEEETANIEEWEEQIRDIQVTLTESENNKLPDEQVMIMLKQFLESNLCQNQGFVLDGYPKTTAQAQELFSGLGEDEGADEETPGEGLEDEINFEAMMGSKMMPQFVFSLIAPDEFLCNRIKQLLERDIEGTHYTEEHMKRRLEEFRDLNTEDDTVLNFFDEMEVHPILIDVTKDETEDMDVIFETIKAFLKEPINFGMSLEEIIEAQMEEEMRKKQEAENAEELRKLEEKAAVECFKEKLSAWAEASQKVQEEEEKIFIAEGESLRTYMMEFIFPTLTKALIEVAKCKPDDPVDFLADYLFRINPEAEMFDPTYNQKGQDLLELCNKALTSATTL